MDDSVSEFIVRTCRILPKTDVIDFIHLQDTISFKDCMSISGSCAELFIQPLQSCIGDADQFCVIPNLLAFAKEKPILPYDVRHLDEAIDCYFIEPYPDFPAFVQLHLLGQITYNWEDKTFEFIQADVQEILKTTEMVDNSSGESYEELLKVGPARKMLEMIPHSGQRKRIRGLFAADIVVSIWCPQWPNEAYNWPGRQRKYGWPTTNIIHEVVQNGCHIVMAKHPACRDDVHQCRLSFSVAEVILLQSWTQIQQIVYHMLRFFAKRELIRKDCPKEDEVLCTYHFKTLMLWSCEEMTPEWWNSSSVIKICCILFDKLSKWLKQRKCPNYFIPHANLFHERFSQKIVGETAKKLIYYCESDILSLWFVEHYMQPSFLRIFGAQCTPDAITWFHEHTLHTCEVVNAGKPRAIDFQFSIRVNEEINNAVKELSDDTFFILIKYLYRIDSLFDNEVDFPPSAEIESCYWFYGSMLRILHAAHLLDCKKMHYDTESFIEIIRKASIKPKFLRSKHHNLPRQLNTGANRSQLYFVKAQDLMENLTGSNDDLEFQAVSEISKGLLRKVMDFVDCRTKVIVKSTLSYLAALHFAASEYETVIDLCSRVIANEKPEKEETETLNAGCLLFIEAISAIIGFYLIFRKTKDASLHYTKRRTFLDLRLTPEVFAHYIALSSTERKAKAFGMSNISQTPSFPLDAILISVSKRKFSEIWTKRNSVLCVYQRTDPTNSFKTPLKSYFPNEDNIIQLLMEYSLEKMISFYNAICKDFGIHCNTADCYRASYLCQRGKYSEVLHLCERILDEPDLQRDLKELAFTNVMVIPPLDSYFDRDVQCLLGFHTLFFYLSPLYEDSTNIEEISNKTFNQYIVRKIHSDQRLLSEVLEEDYIMICHYFLGKHFLARYLKVRCLVDYCNSLSEAILEFKKLKTSLPFEQIIHWFLQGKLRQLGGIEG